MEKELITMYAKVALGGLSEESKIRKESIVSLNLKNGEVVFDVCCRHVRNYTLQ
jgi:hypothetical protein